MFQSMSWMVRAALCAALLTPTLAHSAEVPSPSRLSFATDAKAQPAAPRAARLIWKEATPDVAPATPRRAVSFAERADQSRRRTAERMAINARQVPIRVSGVDYQVAQVAQIVQAGGKARSYRNDALQCLSEALYFEARGEGVNGQTAVAEVILNRVDSGRFPNTVCGVVKQGNARGCQFSYVCDGKADRISEPRAFTRARNVAKKMLEGAPRQLTGGATYFHTPAVRPSWSHRFLRTTRIGRHIFYRPGTRVASN